jgi:NAD(P)-dependent dehydrogenase (short-subunit alcohol dehydrogenase family)
MSKLSGKVAVVTGASKGIGAAIAKALAAEGASVIVNYLSSKAGAERVVAAITAGGGKAVAVGGDVSKPAEAEGIINAAIKNYGRLDILVNNSGVYEFAPIEAITEEHFHKSFNINVLGAILATQAAVKHLGAGGSIINILDLPSGGSRPPTPPSIPPPRPLWMQLRVCSLVNSGQGKFASIPSTLESWRRKARRPRASSVLSSRKTWPRRLPLAGPRRLATSHPLRSSSHPTTRVGSLASSY